jgi:hypothetical protein
LTLKHVFGEGSVARLPDFEAFFRRFFLPWYAASDARGTRRRSSSPVFLREADFDGASPALSEFDRCEVAGQIAMLLEAVVEDWPTFLPVGGQLSFDWVEAFDQHFDEHRIASIIGRSNPGDFANECLVLCSEYGVAIGQSLIQENSELQWIYHWPYWESVVLHPQSGCRIRVFDWAIRRFSDSRLADFREVASQWSLAYCRDDVAGVAPLRKKERRAASLSSSMHKARQIPTPTDRSSR